MRAGHLGDAGAVCVPRLKEPENSSIYSKMRVCNALDTDPKAKSYQEYRDYAGVDEGMNGLYPFRL